MQTPDAEFFSRTRTRRLQLRGLEASAIEAKVGERAAARTAKDFARADAIRAELTQMGVELQDVVATGKTTWRVLV
jgi:cysteinyl-tRNA synthetase